MDTAPDTTQGLSKEVDTSPRRYNLTLPYKVYDALAKIAEQEGIKETDVLRDLVKTGLVIHKIAEDPCNTLIIKNCEENTETHIVLVK